MKKNQKKLKKNSYKKQKKLKNQKNCYINIIHFFLVKLKFEKKNNKNKNNKILA